MPTAEQILAALARTSQDWWGLAVWWHVYFLILAVAVVVGNGRVAIRATGVLLSIPIASVVVLAWVSGNPFTTVLLGAAFLVALFLSWRLPPGHVSLSRAPLVLMGMLMSLFGLVYPHFLGDATPTIAYAYAAPIGIVPCPTLAAIAGISITVRSLGSREWGLLIGLVSVFYAMFGALRLGVTLDWVLLVGALVLLGVAVRESRTADGKPRPAPRLHR